MSHPTPIAFPGRRLRGFTLLELLIAIAVMAILLSTSVPLVRAVFQANALVGSVNQVSAALNTARAIALRDGTDAAVIFLGGTDGRMHLRLVKFNGEVVGGRMRFVNLDDRPPERLPINILVRGFTGTTTTLFGGMTPITSSWEPATPFSFYPADTYNTGTIDAPVLVPHPGVATPATCFAVWFGSDGLTRTSTPSGINGLTYVVPGGGPPATIDATPTSLLLLYDHQAYQTYYSSNGSFATATLEDWLANSDTKATVRLVNFNRYSGLIVNR